jgi:hypothetical protein
LAVRFCKYLIYRSGRLNSPHSVKEWTLKIYFPQFKKYCVRRKK